ncbi:MAG: formylglycine-generating enzyme family protein [Prochloraceae cyanobacterium]|nr:formylglycine-generating enzyme family protein [Prochloraceae cyanobacterium]
MVQSQNSTQRSPKSSEKRQTILQAALEEFLSHGYAATSMDRINKTIEVFSENLGNGVVLEMVKIPGGTFTMGSTQSELGHRADEMPTHQVKVPSFYMGKFPITQQQWKEVGRLRRVDFDLDRTRKLNDPRYPIENVCWYSAVEFCERLSKKTGRLYRLPSEAEWEYGARAQTTTPFHFGKSIGRKLANCNFEYTKASLARCEYVPQITTVGNYFPNAFGLYDMHGLVWEWCADDYRANYEGAPTDGSVWFSDAANGYKVLRGGCWSHFPRFCRSAMRNYNNPTLSYNGIGCRVVMQ